MGPRAPLWFSRGDHVAQRAETMKQHDDKTLVVFSQVWAAEKRKTLLLLWWIGLRNMTTHSAQAWQGRLGESGYARTSVQWSESFSGLPWPSFYELRGYHNGKIVIIY